MLEYFKSIFDNDDAEKEQLIKGYREGYTGKRG